MDNLTGSYYQLGSFMDIVTGSTTGYLPDGLIGNFTGIMVKFSDLLWQIV